MHGKCLSLHQGPLVDVFAIDWFGPNTPVVPSPWGTFWVPEAASNESEAAFWGWVWFEGAPSVSCVGARRAAGRGAPPLLCCGGTDAARMEMWVFFLGAEMEPTGTFVALDLSFSEGVEDGPLRQYHCDPKV